MADRTATLKAVRGKYPQYADMTDDALGRALATKYPAYADLAPAPSAVASRPMPPAPPMIAPGTILSGALKETFGMGERPGAVPLTGPPETKTPLGVLLKPEGAAEHLAQAAVMAPGLAAAGGAGAALGVPAAVGRVAAAGGLGAARAALAGEDATWGGIVDALVAAGTEGGMGVLPPLGLPRMFGVPSLADLAEKMRSTKAGLRHATEAPMQAFDMLRARLPKGKWLNVPTLAKAAPRTTREAATRSIEPLRPSPTTPSEAGYHYHATNENNAAEIARSGLKTHKPSYGTDQSVWPDGGVQRRSYLTPRAGVAYQFSSTEGRPVLLRVRNDRGAFRGDGTGDTYVREAIPAKHIEIANADGTWRPLQESRAIRGTKELLTVDEAVKRLAELTGPEYRVARAEIASELSRLDVQRVTGPKPLAGAIFK